MSTIDRTYTIGETLLKIDNVNLSLGSGAGRKLILRDVMGSVANIIRPGMEQGQVVGLLGPSGIGKTQLFRIIAGFNKPDSGAVLLGASQTPSRSGQVGVVPQDYVVFPHMTVLQNLVFAGKQSGLSAKEAEAKALEYLEKFDLADRRNNWPGQISGGQRQRVAILQQIMIGHQFICMDEPFSGLDVNQVHNVARLICQMTSLNELLTIIVVTHDIGAAIEVSDTLWLMGKERDETTGTFFDGARIVNIYDLISMGLAWDPALRQNPSFLDLEAQITERFRTLA